MADSGLHHTVEEMILEVWRESRAANVRLAEVGVELRTMTQQITEIRVDMRSGTAGLTGRIEGIEARLGKVEGPVDELEDRREASLARRQDRRRNVEDKALTWAGAGILAFLGSHAGPLLHRMGW